MKKKIIEKEKGNKETMLEKSKIELYRIELELRTLREKENEIIQSTSSTYTKLQEFERIYRKLTENEKKTIKELNLLEKEIAITNKDILDLQNQKINQINELQELGYKEILESYDVENIISRFKSRI